MPSSCVVRAVHSTSAGLATVKVGDQPAAVGTMQGGEHESSDDESSAVSSSDEEVSLAAKDAASPHLDAAEAKPSGDADTRAAAKASFGGSAVAGAKGSWK